MALPETFAAGEPEAGHICPCCQGTIRAGEPVGRCPQCGHVQHARCWEESGRCFSYECDPATARERGAERPELVVTAEDAAQAEPPAPPKAAVRMPTWSQLKPAGKRRTSVLAVAALVCGILGVFLAGVPGLFAVVLGALAVGLINSRKDLKGAGLAAAGIIIGVVALVGWTAGLSLVLVSGSWKPWTRPVEPPTITQTDQTFTEADLKDVPDHIRRAIRANVMIMASSPGQLASGSGVVLEKRDGVVFIITNRHVVEGAATMLGGTPTIQVTFSDGTKATGEVIWQAPTGVDLALVRCNAVGRCCQIAFAAARPRLSIGETVFAVGNPLGLGWTYTNGVISAVRRGTYPGGHAVRIIQMQTPLNPGNSGGGLYTKDGRLIGINTFTAHKHASEGINFALVISDLLGPLRSDGGVRVSTGPPPPSPQGPDPE
jgi:S1-C subfamily serine protease